MDPGAATRRFLVHRAALCYNAQRAAFYTETGTLFANLYGSAGGLGAGHE
jgi:hypothetical protein